MLLSRGKRRISGEEPAGIPDHGARFAPKRRRSPEFVNPMGSAYPFVGEIYGNTYGKPWHFFFGGGTTFLDAISFRPSNTGDLPRRDHITFYCHQVRQLRASIPCLIFARLSMILQLYCLIPCGNLWQSTSHEWKTRRQPLENLKLENWTTTEKWKATVNWKTTGHHWKPTMEAPLVHHGSACRKHGP